MKSINLLLLAAALLFTAGCATQGHDHSMMGQHAMMGCAKCSCKMMKPGTADSNQCAMCGHTAAEHNKPSTDTKDSSEHQH